ncbi:glycosyltransferase [Zobellia roscoffensis]|uniref:glycosyltransferase n=1 Tax=Zobellia roscoffensis TaxID=2779508 RepID=UPI00188AD2FA|nr:glycosyltransferase [Zobellia roscoffensis]
MEKRPTSNSTILSLQTTPLLSVIIPVYNVAEYLDRCIESVIKQSYANLEIILIDDGSTDESWSICQAYKKKDNRIITLQQPNSGSSVARNTGLDIATGDYIAFIDSDDYIKQEMFQTMLSFALTNNITVVECSLIQSNKNTNSEISSNGESFIETQEEAIERLIRDKNWSVWRRIYRSDVLSNLRFIPGKIHQDVFFTIDVLNKIEKQGYIAKAFYVYNTDNESITRSAYNIKKLNAKDAPYYVFNKTQQYNLLIRTLASKYLIRTLLSHYDRLFLNNHLDENYIHRKEIKSEITDQLNLEYENNSLFGTLAKISPFWLYKIILNLNEFRIKIRLMLLKL